MGNSKNFTFIEQNNEICLITNQMFLKSNANIATLQYDVIINYELSLSDSNVIKLLTLR